MTDETAPAKALTVRAPLNSGGALMAIVPQDIEQVFRLAKAIKVSGFAPKSYKTEEEIVVGIMHGMEVGLTPLAALQSIAVINGTPTIWGDGALALVRGSGLLVDFREWFEGETAWCEAKRRDQSEPIRRSFSIADAKRAKLWEKRGRDGQDTPWITYPQRMLQMRARSWCLRDGFADVLRGLKLAEEVQDYRDPADAKDITPPKPQGNGFRMATPPSAVDKVATQLGGAVSASESAHSGMEPAGATPAPPPDHDAATGELLDAPDPGRVWLDGALKDIGVLGTTGALKNWWEANKTHIGALDIDARTSLQSAYRTRVAALKSAPDPADAMGAA